MLQGCVPRLVAGCAGRIAEVGSVRSCSTPGAQLLPSARRCTRAPRTSAPLLPATAACGSLKAASRGGVRTRAKRFRDPYQAEVDRRIVLFRKFIFWHRGTPSIPDRRGTAPGWAAADPRAPGFPWCGGGRFGGAPVRLRVGAGGAAPHGRGECGRGGAARRGAGGGAGPGRGAARGRGSGRAGAARRGGAAPRGRPGPPVWPCPPPPALGRFPAPAAPPAAPPPPRRAMRSCFCLRRGSREPPPAARGTVKCPRPRRRPRPAPLREGRKEGRTERGPGLRTLAAPREAGPGHGAAEPRSSRAVRGPRGGAARDGGRNRSRGATRAGPGPQDAAVLLGAGRGLLRGSARAGLLLRGAGLRARVGRRPRRAGEFAANFVLGWLEGIAAALRYVVFCCKRLRRGFA